jgi:preprotein translocase subunit Sss1
MVEKELNCFNLEPYEAVGVPSALTKKFEEYKTNSIQKKAAYFSNTYLKTRFEFGSKPLRIYVTMVSQPEEVMENVDVVAFDENTIIPAWLKMDSKKMLKKTVKPKIEELLKTLGIEWTSLNLKEELKEIKKVKVKKKKKEGKKDKVKKGEKGPLDSFIGGK